MTRLLHPQRAAPIPLVLLAVAALAVAVGGLEHEKLFHEGYAQVDVVGPLFLLNAIGSAVTVLLLVFDRPLLFVLGSLSISVGSLVSIVISHSSSFFKFAEASYDSNATTIVIAEIVATVFALAGGALLLMRPSADASGAVA